MASYRHNVRFLCFFGKLLRTQQSREFFQILLGTWSSFQILRCSGVFPRSSENKGGHVRVKCDSLCLAALQKRCIFVSSSCLPECWPEQAFPEADSSTISRGF